ncbi:MAG TPA: phytoene desaturase family protein [bacterium]|nr:phytoene desaturase family protein [bacterium]
MTNCNNREVVVVGSGLGGLSAAISLAQEGYSVEIHEKNSKIGGKLNFLSEQGYTFDLGPSILTLPHFFERLFARSGRKMADYFSIVAVRPHWRSFFPDGKTIDLYPEPELMAREAVKAGASAKSVECFLDYSARLYDLIDRGYFQEGLDSTRDILRFYGWCALPRFDPLRSMHSGVARHIQNPYLKDIFDFFVKYVGSSAYRAPAMLNCLPTIQFRYDLWYVNGGMYNIARGLQKLLGELGVAVHLNSEVTEFRTSQGRVTGIVVNGDRFHKADIVVCNMEVIPAYRDILKEDATFLRSLRKFQPACSGLVIDLGLDIQYPHLAHHNFFFSGDQQKHFDSVFRKKVLPEDPTIYLVAASRTDPTVAPAGTDCLKILPHIPPIDPEHPLQLDDYTRLRDRILIKLEKMGLTDLRKHIVFEHFWTPYDIQKQYYSNQGSIYGVVSDRYLNFAFKAPKHSSRYDNLFFVGGSVNPGAGMPMVVLCGQNVCRDIVRWDQLT